MVLAFPQPAQELPCAASRRAALAEKSWRLRMNKAQKQVFAGSAKRGGLPFGEHRASCVARECGKLLRLSGRIRLVQDSRATRRRASEHRIV